LDGFRDVSDGIVKPLRGGAQRLGLYSGAVSTGGSPVPVIDPEEVIRRFESVRGGTLEAAQAAPRSTAATVLVVDDSLTTRTLEKSILEAHGYDVALAVDGEDGLRKMRSVRPDVVVVDVQMPRMTGLDMIERMKADERLSDIPVVIVSSLESREDKARGMSLGADAYIVKRKFDHRGLLDTIRQII
jgi:two-component system chemotaxis sensor kinase CheA